MSESLHHARRHAMAAARTEKAPMAICHEIEDFEPKEFLTIPLSAVNRAVHELIEVVYHEQ